MPTDAKARARAVMWMFNALNTMEPPIVEREAFVLVESDKSYFNERLPILDQRLNKRLKELSDSLGASEWLDGDFSAADILMVTVLRRALKSGLVDAYPNLTAYIARGEARAAYQRAFAAQPAVFNATVANS